MSFPKYPEYKDSGVEWIGDIPAHWITAPIKNLADVINGYPFDSKLFSPTGQHPLVRIRDLNKIETEANYDGEFLDSAAITSEDILIGMDGDFNVGRWNGQGRALLNQRMCCVRGHKDIINRLIEYALPFPLKAINDITYSTTVKHLSSYQVQKTFIALPPHEQEQSAIAAFLDRETAKIDALVAEQEKLIELLKEKRQAVISHAVTKGLDPNVPMKDSGVEWLGEVPEHWAVAKLRRFVRAVQTGGTPSASPPNTDIEDGTDWFTPGDFSGPIRLGSASKKVPPEAIEHGEAKVFPAGAVLVVGIGATLGKIGYLLTLASANQQINAILPNAEVDGLFLAYSLSSKTAEMRNLSNASTIGIMNQEKTKEIWVAVPPRCEQETIAKFLDEDGVTSDALVNEAQRAIDLLKERRSALISAAVTGKIDVRGLADATQ